MGSFSLLQPLPCPSSFLSPPSHRHAELLHGESSGSTLHASAAAKRSSACGLRRGNAEFIQRSSAWRGLNARDYTGRRIDGMPALPSKGCCQAVRAGPSESTETVATREQSGSAEIDNLVGGISFSQLCDDFECVSSPAVERTARQLARDIIDLKENRRLLSCYGPFVKYKDPLRSFTGREKFKRPSWLLNAIEKPEATVLQMVMRNTSELTIRWRVKGTLRLAGASIVSGPLTLTVRSIYVLNQISGQVTEQSDEWDLSGSSPPAVVYFWSSRLAWTVAETGRDAKEAVMGVQKLLSQGMDDGPQIYSDPRDPRRFFQDNNPNSELYQYGLLLALVYLLVQFLQLVL